MNKVLFFDPIDKGYRHFLRLNNKFKESGYETLLVHTTSFNHPIKDNEYDIDNLKIRDISYYNTIFFRKVIEKESPSIILIINLSFVLDRAIVNIAKRKKIRIVYLAHGSLTNPTEFDKIRDDLDKEIKGNVKRVFSKKNFYGLLNYIDSKKTGKKTISLIKLIMGIMMHPSQYLTLAQFDKELDVDLLLVYEKKDKLLLSEKMNFPESKIKVVRNPEISEFINLPILEKKEFLTKCGINANKYVVYLDDGLVDNKIWKKEEWYNHLISIAHILNEQHILLIVKLHPRMDLNLHDEFFLKYKNSIIPVMDIDFKNLLYHASFVISHYSSTVIYALLFNKKVIIPKWVENSRKLSNKYPEEVVQYSYNLSDIVDISHEKISNEHIVNISKFLDNMGINVTANSIDIVTKEIIG